MTLKDTALRGICWVRQKREEKKRIWKLTEGLGSETLQQNMRCISSFLVLHWKKSNIIVWKGISGNKLPPSAWNSKKDTERQKKGQSNLQMLLSKPSLKILWLSKALIKKKKQVTTDAICQPLQQILLYIKRSNVFEMQLFQKPQDSAFRAVQIVLFMLTLILRQIFCSALFQLYFIRASALCHSQNYTPQLESLRATQPSPLVQPELKLMPVLPLLSVCSYLKSVMS